MTSIALRAYRAGKRLAARVSAPAVALRAHRAGLARPLLRDAFLRQVPKEDALEIGPFASPTLIGPGVTYFDVLDTPALHARAAALGWDRSRIPPISYVSPMGDLAVVDRQFTAALSSHAIEHQPDLVAHLAGVERLLYPGGRYWIIVPDKRYTFDRLLPETTLDEVLEAHRTGRKVHTPAAVLAHRLGTTHNNAIKHWLGLHGSLAPAAAVRASAQADAARAEAGDYIDVHALIVTPVRFAAIVEGLNRKGLTTLEVEAVHDTPFATHEFCAVLRKPA